MGRPNDSARVDPTDRSEYSVVVRVTRMPGSRWRSKADIPQVGCALA